RQLNTHLRQTPHTKKRMAALRHVRSQTTLEIAVTQPRHLPQEFKAQTNLEVAAETKGRSSDREFQNEQRREEDQDAGDCSKPLPGHTEFASDIKHAAKQKRLQQHCSGCNCKRAEYCKRSQRAIEPQ